MSKEYLYRKNWKIFWMVMIIGMFYGLLICFIFLHPTYPSAIITGICILGITLLTVYILRARISVSIEDDAIIYKSRRKEKKILFNAISNLKVSFWEVENGIKIVSENNTILLSPAIQNISGLLQELRNAIEQKGLSINYDRKKFFSFFKMAVHIDQRWARDDLNFWKIIVIIILNSVIGIVCAISSRFGSIWFDMGAGLWIIFSVFFPLYCNSYAEVIFKRRLAKQIDEQSFTYPPRDIAYEKTIYRKVLIFGALIYIVISIVAVFILRSRGI